MKNLNFKNLLIICLIINGLSNSLAQSSNTNLDSINRDIAQMREKEWVNNHSVINKKYYIEGSFGVNCLPFISLIQRNVLPKNLSRFTLANFSLSGGYQFKPYLGLGITAQNDILIDYTSVTIKSLLVDYRLDFRNKVIALHGGFVTVGTRMSSDVCSIKFDKTRPRNVWGISIKQYFKHHFFVGVSFFNGKVPVNEVCSINNQSIASQTSKKFATFNVLVGFNLPARYNKK
jgi:hypothetical protein